MSHANFFWKSTLKSLIDYVILCLYYVGVWYTFFKNLHHLRFSLIQSIIINNHNIYNLLISNTYLGNKPNNSGARKIQDNISDLKAQVAANNKGASY